MLHPQRTRAGKRHGDYKVTKKSLKLTEIPPELRAAEATLFAAVNAPGRSKICQACKRTARSNSQRLRLWLRRWLPRPPRRRRG